MLHVRDASDLPLLTTALRALRCFQGNELLIYQEMLMSELPESLIIDAYRELEPEEDPDYDPEWENGELTPRELASFLYVRGERAGRQAGREEGRQEGRQEGLRFGRRAGLHEGLLEGQALALLHLLAARGISVDSASTDRIRACRDAEQLTQWLTRALVIGSIDELWA